LLVLPDVYVVHLFSEAHIFASFHVVVQILIFIFHFVFELLLLLSFVQVLRNLICRYELIRIMVLHTIMNLFLEPLNLSHWENLFIFELSHWIIINIEQLVHLIYLSGNDVLLLKFLVHYLMGSCVDLIITGIHVNHLINTLHIN